MQQTTSFYSWVRKGLVGQVDALDDNGNGSDKTAHRANVQLKANLETISCSDDSEANTRLETKTVSLSGPGDILSLNPNAIVRVFPVDGTINFPTDGFPYIEFWEPDFAWRFTPARANDEGGNKTKLRPWLTLVVCKSTQCSVEKSSWNTDIVTFKVDDDACYKNIFPSPTEVWKSAHVQGSQKSDQICRILGEIKDSNEVKEGDDAEYRAFLIPVFELGRLRGIYGPDYDDVNLKDIPVQRPAWEASLGEQNKRDFPLKFPSYYSWSFKRGGLSFAKKVKALKCNNAKKSGIDVDVTSLGEGLDYNILPKKPNRNKISIPAALTTIRSTPETVFPNPNSDEKTVYDNLNSLLSKSPVFDENIKIKGNGNGHDVEEDDPWITPPIYGGKHALAISLKDEDNKESPWLRPINLDLHYRSAAGLGKKAVQRNQEELVNRAWQQIDAVKTMNAELNQKMLSTNVNDSVKYLNYKWVGPSKAKITSKKEESELLSQMMMNLSSMKNTTFDGVSLSSILKKKGIPEVFVSDSFRRTAEKTLENTSYPDFIQSIAEQQIYVVEGANKAEMLKKDELNTFAKTSIVPYLCRYFVKNSELNKWFNWVDGDKFIKPCEYISSYNGAKGNVANRLWSSCNRVIDCYVSLRRSCGEPGAIDYFVDNELWKISSTGYIYSGDTLPEPGFTLSNQIYALDSGVFKTLFYMSDDSYSPVVRINSYYYIDRDRICDFISDDSEGKKLAFYVNHYDGSVHTWYKIGRHVTSNDIMNLKSKTSFSREEKWKLCADAVLYMPDCVIAQKDVLDKIAQDKGYLLDNARSLYLKLIENYKKKYGENDKNIRLNNAWEKLKTFIDGIVLTPDPQAPEYKGAIDDILKLKGGLRDDSVYAQLKERAAVYYSTFFSNDDLIRGYLADCLASKYPIKAYPIFPEPTYYYLRDIADEFILPGIEELPDDTISMFKGNPAFIESYLCGMNTEMGRELLWREYPTDQRGAYFKKFWDSSTSAEDIVKDNFFDVQSIHCWNNELGKNHMVSADGKSKGDLLFFAIKGDLMKLYPDTSFTLEKAECRYEKNKSLEFRLDASASKEDVLHPVSQGFVRDDVYVVGFQIKSDEALGCPPKKEKQWEKCGYMLVFEKAKENIEFVSQDDNTAECSALYAKNHLDQTSRVGKHVSTLIGKN